MYVAACRLDIQIPGSRSLKDRRRVVQSAVERLRHRYHVSAAEVYSGDQWQRSAIGLAFVSGDLSHAQRVVDEAARWLRANLDGEVLEEAMTAIGPTF